MSFAVLRWLDNTYDVSSIIKQAATAPKISSQDLVLHEQQAHVDGEYEYQGPAIVLKYETRYVVLLGTLEAKKAVRLLSSPALKKTRLLSDADYQALEEARTSLETERRTERRPTRPTRSSHSRSRSPYIR